MCKTNESGTDKWNLELIQQVGNLEGQVEQRADKLNGAKKEGNERSNSSKQE
jgi:hypothetical protein